MHIKSIALAVPLVLGLGACSQPKPDEAAPTVQAAPEPTDPAAANGAAQRPRAWAQCQVCHTVDTATKSGIGPNLHGIVGRKAGTLAGYAYSPAMTSANLTWDAATLDRYLEHPRALVPATKMAYAGLKNASDRQELIAWLAEQK